MGFLFNGNEDGRPASLPASGMFFDFDGSTIRMLLTRSHVLEEVVNGVPTPITVPAKGIRFHLNQPRPTLPTEIYAAACGVSNDIADPTGNGDDYFKVNNNTVTQAELDMMIDFASKANSCVYFSEKVLITDILGPDEIAPKASKVRILVDDFIDDDANGNPVTHPGIPSLIAVGLDDIGNMTGPRLMSRQPCPPQCPDGYP